MNSGENEKKTGLLSPLFFRITLVVGAAAFLLSFLPLSLGHIDGHRYFLAYLTAFAFFLSLSLGGMFFVLIHHVTAAGWSVVIRRTAEHFMKNIGLMFLFFLPIAFLGLVVIYHWMHPAPGDLILQKKSPYLNMPFFLIRSAIYFGVWLFIARYFFRESVLQDKDGVGIRTLSMQRRATYCLFLFAGTLTFASFDYLMSLDPHWYSTIFGVYFFSGSSVGFLASLGMALVILQATGRLRNVVNTEHYHDVGKLLFGFTVFWGYIAFSQYLIIWYGNIPEETTWYAIRQQGVWLVLSLLLAGGHLVVPLIFFMSRNVKRHIGFSFAMYFWLFAMHALDIYYLVMPAVMGHGKGEHFAFSLTDAAVFIGMGAIFIGFLFRRMARYALYPIQDPRLEESLRFENV